MREVSFVGSDSALLSGEGACSDAAARVSEARHSADAQAFSRRYKAARPAKGSPSEERLPPAGGRCRVSDKKGNLATPQALTERVLRSYRGSWAK